MNSSFDEVNAIHMCRSPLKKEGLSKYQQVQKVPFSGFEKLSVPSSLAYVNVIIEQLETHVNL